MERKGFPESYDVRSLLRFVLRVKSGDRNVPHTLYSHNTYDILEGEERVVDQPDVLIVDDFGLRRLNPQQSSDFYDVIIQRHRRATTIVTSNRAIEEWIPLFDDPILAQSALDRLAHNAHQVVIEGDSYRKKQRPGERLASQEEEKKNAPATSTTM